MNEERFRTVFDTVLFMMINANAAITLLEKRPGKNFQTLNGIRTHDLCDTGAMLSQMSYQSYMRAVVCGLALYSSGVMAAFASIIISTVNCYCWTSITMEFTYLSRVLRPLNIKGQN